ncbi:ATPase [Nocardiopsis gilva YIM 90087]|uniref:ATPase n=3 Tax=Nocardiopsis gilva TaxID=280236 RepID=A0A223S764_9ACTN|nr:TM0106 family RecB-like putative nuclease [Nocardiopsis gilva]ASU83933.1 ATPase [Nocardiopsis gilva YIM 90087]
MFRNETGWVISPTDLVDAMECDHRSALKAALAARVHGVPAPAEIDPLVARSGAAHEQAELDRLRQVFGEGVVEIDNPEPTHAAMAAAAQATAAAMASGVPVIYQGVFYEPGEAGVAFHGRADFLIRDDTDPATGQDRPGRGTYEPYDTKLAHHPGPGALVQLAAYAAALGRMGPAEPEHMYLVTGDGATHAYRVADFTPLLASVTDRLTGRLRGPITAPDPLWGEPRPSCERCGYAAMCREGRTAARHLTLVAGIRSDQARKLSDAGITTIDALAAATEEDRPPTLPRHSYTRLREQAALQVRQDATRTAANPTGEVIAQVYAPDGLAGLPAPSPGDIFFDMEGYPYFDGADGRGLEYLFGAVTEEDGAAHFHAFWAHDRTEEKQAFEDFVDFATARLEADPEAHIYHYASYEVDRLKSLAAAFATREREVDLLLRTHRLVDLYTVVRKSLRISQRSYSIKYLEPLYFEGRDGDVATATASIDAYADYLGAVEAHDSDRAEKILTDIGAYNYDDCVSTARLRDWLEERRTAEGITVRPAVQTELSEAEDDKRRKREEKEARLRALTDPLMCDVPADTHRRDAAQQARARLAALAGYYPREEKPSWWEYFRRVSAPVEELESDNDCLVPLRVAAGEWQEPTGRQRRARRELQLRADPTRPHPFSADDRVRLLYPGPPGQGADTVDATVTAAAADRLTLTETAEPEQLYARAPAAVLPGPPIQAAPKDAALESLVEQTIAHQPDWLRLPGVDVLRRLAPRLRGGGALPDPAEHGGDLIATAIAAVDRLEDSYLAVQGPPGAGKTYLAAQLITHLVGRGATVGVCSTSHKAVENVLAAAVRAGADAGTPVPAAKRPSGKQAPDPDLPWEQPRSLNALSSWRAKQEGGYLIGGTAWGLANATMLDDPMDVLIIDEAGQFALADTLAVSAAARNLVLLGDPQQLPQVVQGTHADGADASALEHLVGEEEIIDASRGYFLDETRRMHPAVCAPVSALSYRGRLHAHPSAAERGLGGVEAGLYQVPVAHSGRSTHSPEEVEAAIGLAATLVGTAFTEPGADPRPLQPDDILMVAPYNLQVRALRRALREAGLQGVRVGTVDKFQGQEAPVVLCSMTVSSALEVPRGLDFVLSRNRLNVALSRAQVLAALVYSPDLLTAAPRSVAELRVLAGFAGLCHQARLWPGHDAP